MGKGMNTEKYELPSLSLSLTRSLFFIELYEFDCSRGGSQTDKYMNMRTSCI